MPHHTRAHNVSEVGQGGSGAVPQAKLSSAHSVLCNELPQKGARRVAALTNVARGERGRDAPALLAEGGEREQRHREHAAHCGARAAQQESGQQAARLPAAA